MADADMLLVTCWSAGAHREAGRQSFQEHLQGVAVLQYTDVEVLHTQLHGCSNT